VLKYPDSSASIVARYKLGWCYINTADYETGFKLFEEAVSTSRGDKEVDIDTYRHVNVRLESLIDMAFCYPEVYKKNSTPEEAMAYFRKYAIVSGLGRHLSSKGRLSASMPLKKIALMQPRASTLPVSIITMVMKVKLRGCMDKLLQKGPKISSKDRYTHVQEICIMGTTKLQKNKIRKAWVVLMIFFSPFSILTVATKAAATPMVRPQRPLLPKKTPAEDQHPQSECHRFANRQPQGYCRFKRPTACRSLRRRWRRCLSLRHRAQCLGPVVSPTGAAGRVPDCYHPRQQFNPRSRFEQ
jgi:hypothetical protein